MKMSAINLNAHLTVSSLGLLGFNREDYKEHYAGLTKELSAITTSSFDRENECELLCCLHFLLIRLDYEVFSRDIQKCWPYLHRTSKYEYKRAVNASLQRLDLQKKSPLFTEISPAFWTSDYIVKGPDVWILLRILTDLCVDMAINALGGNAVDYSVVYEGDNQKHNNADTIVEIPKDLAIRRQSLSSLSFAGFQSISNIDLKVITDTPLSPPPLPGPSREQLLSCISEHQKQTEQMLTQRINKQNRHCSYMEELEQRRKAAKSKIDVAKRKMRKSLKSGDFFAHTEAGRSSRAMKLEKMASSVRLLQELSQSELLMKASAFLLQGNEHQKTSKLITTELIENNSNGDNLTTKSIISAVDNLLNEITMSNQRVRDRIVT